MTGDSGAASGSASGPRSSASGPALHTAFSNSSIETSDETASAAKNPHVLNDGVPLLRLTLRGTQVSAQSISPPDNMVAFPWDEIVEYYYCYDGGSDDRLSSAGTLIEQNAVDSSSPDHRCEDCGPYRE